MTGRALLLLGLIYALAPARAATPRDSDAARLSAPLPSGFRRADVLIYPPVDLRPPSQAGETPAAWAAFVSSLASRPNLRTRTPTATLDVLRSRPGYTRALLLAQATARRGREDYRRVKLERAAEELGEAIDAMVDLEHHIVAPHEVARLALVRAQALLEAGERTAAGRGFRQALSFDPQLRLIPGTDSPKAVAALETARANPGPPTPRLAVNLSSNRYIVRGWIHPNALVITLQSAGGLRQERIPLSTPDAGDRMASRVWACLPFGRAPIRSRHRSRLFLDAGFNYDVFIGSSAVDVISNFGAGMNLSWLVARNLALDANLALSNSNRDQNEDLREDVSAVRLFVGPGFSAQAGALRASANVGFAAETLSEVITTRNVACKYFPEREDVPLCDRERDLDRQGRTWRVGPALTLTASVRLVERIFLSARFLASKSIFETVDDGLGFPLGLQMGLGYQLF